MSMTAKNVFKVAVIAVLAVAAAKRAPVVSAYL